MGGIVGVMKPRNLMRLNMEDNQDFPKADPELIITKLKDILEFIRKLKKEGKI